MSDPNAATVAAPLTPLGRGAIAVVSVRGPRAVASVSRCFVSPSGRRLETEPCGRILWGLWTRPASEAACRDASRAGDFAAIEPAGSGEDLIVCRVAEDTVEVHCHGGQAAVARVLDSLRSCGCDIAVASAAEDAEQPLGGLSFGESSSSGWTARVAWRALPQATTWRAATVLLDQAHGALDAAMARITSHAATDPGQALAEVDLVCRFASLGARLLRPWRVVLVGRPNVGKSSLINAILGFERTVVHAEPGTTRDVVTAATALDGWPVEFTDTAGLREVDEVLEAEGIRRSLAELEAADLVLIVRDVTESQRPQTLESPGELELPPGLQRPCLSVWNKADLLEVAPAVGASAAGGHRVSARTGQGLEELLAAIVGQLIPEVPAMGTAVPWTADQRAWLQQARDAILAGRSPPTR